MRLVTGKRVVAHAAADLKEQPERPDKLTV